MVECLEHFTLYIDNKTKYALVFRKVPVMLSAHPWYFTTHHLISEYKMLTNWRIEGFKAIRSRVDLPLASLTIFTGSNSSGKSTVLQSMLVIAQTLQHRNHDIPLITNGALLSLGGFDDILNDESKSRKLTIGFTLQPANILVDKPLQTIAIPSFDASGTITGRSIWNPQTETALLESISMDATFGKNEEKNNLAEEKASERITLNECNLTVLTRLNNDTEFEFITTARKRDSYLPKKTDIKAENDYECRIDDIQKKALKDFIALPYEPWEMKRENLFDSNALRCRCNHFIPKDFNILRNLGVEAILALRNGLVKAVDVQDLNFMIDPRIQKREDIKKLTHEMRAIMIDSLDEIFIDDKDEENEVRAILTSSSPSSKFEAEYEPLINIATGNRLLEYVKKKDEFSIAYEAALKKAKSMDDLIVDETLNPPWLDDVQNTTRDYFSTSIAYIGPLRAEPKNYYNTRLNLASYDIGAKGEYAGEVYLDNLNTDITYISPPTINNLGVFLSPNNGTLKQAMAEWMRHLTIAEDINVEYLGRNGYRILVRLADDKNFCDISDVGVGISQIFPILVMGLLSKQDSTMIFEQPELHLHPKVQTRLADFFISLALLNKQSIVESHSEHIINQLRYRIAHDSNSNELKELTRIYFVEKADSSSEFTPVEINEYGAIPDWPDGFFDQNTNEIIDTIRIESLKKGFHDKSN